MNCKYMNMLRVVRGNAFKLKIAVEAYTPSGRRIDSFTLGEAVLKLDKNGTLTTKEYTILEGTTILVAFDGSESLGVYGFQMTGEYEGEAWRWANAEIFQIVESNVKAHIPEGCVLLDDTYNMALKIVLSGGDGVTFTPSVSEQGIISWTNDGGLPNPEPRNIRGPRGEQGPQGEVGPQGPRGQMGLRGQIGPKGDKGDKGDTGATPVLDVTASVDENIGNPMVVVESFGPAEHRTFDFQFKNLKGQKGETGATGPQGPQGQQGEPGNYTKPASGIPLSDLNGNVASGIVYDVTANNSGATFASLSALLSSGSLSTLIPTDVRKGGMQIRFVCSSDNNYVQFRYMNTDAATNSKFVNVANWQGVDDEVQAVFSKNLVSGGAVRRALGNEKIDWIANKNINLSGGVGSTVPSPLIASGWGYCDIPCDEGSIVVISGNGGNYGLWGFVNNEDKIISWSGTNINKNDLQLIAPEGAVRVIVNSYSYSTRTPPVISLSDSVEVRTKNTIIGTDNILDDAVTTPKINDSAITKAKVADKAITIEKTNFDLIDSIVGSFDYTGSIAELYVFAPVAQNSFVSVKSNGGCLYVDTVTSEGYYPSQHWTATTKNYSLISNGEVCLVKCSTANESLGVSVGDVVGYVVFKDVDKIKSYNDGTRGYRIKYTENTYTLTKNPIISSSLHKVSDLDFADNFIEAVVVNNTVYDARYCIAEFYLKKDAVVFNNDSHKYVICKVYGNSIYVQSYNGTTNYGWQSVYDISNWKNNAVYELKVTAAGLNENYEVGDVVGYIAFKDITKFKTLTSGGRPANVIRDNVTQLWLSPMIYAYLQSKNVEIDNVLTFADIQIPNDIYIVEGNQLMLFYKSIVKSYNPYIYGLRVVCSVGKAYPKYYILDATNTGDYSISFNVVDKDDNIISTKTSTIHVISAMSAPSANKNVLVFGASTMADGVVTGELKRRLTESSGDGTTQNPTGLGLSNITFVGRKQGTTVNVNQEATGGWSWKDYSTEGQLAYRFNVTGVNQLNINDTYTCNGVTLTIAEINVTSGSGNIRCTYSGTSTLPASGTLTRSSGSGDSTITYTSYESESYNPFWNPNKTGGAGLDFTNYANEYCNGSIDVMIACCGYNDFNRYTPNTIGDLFTDYVKPFIRAYHTAFPNGKFIISTQHLPTPNGGMAANYGAASNWNWLTTAHKIWAFAIEAEKLVNESEFSSYVYLSEVTSEFDCEHSYPTAQAYVNNRSSVQETVTTNGVHFTTVGAYQVSDSLYHTFNNLGL